MINLTKLLDLSLLAARVKIIRAKIETLYESKVEIKKAEPPVSKKIEKKKKKRK